MGFLERLKASQAQQNSDWKTLSDISQLNSISQDSNTKPVIIFKHSTTCGISAGAKHRLEADWNQLDGDFDFYYLDLLSYRTISKTIAEKWNIRHESPQVIVIKNDKSVYNASHGSISINMIQPHIIA